MANQLSTESPNLDATYAALSARPRRVMLERLRRGPAAAGELWDGLGISKPSVSKHLRVLEASDLIERRRDGRVHRFRLRAEPLEPATAWLMTYRTFWESRIDALAELLESDADLTQGDDDGR